MKITKSQLQQVIKEAIQEEMSSFDMAEDVIELLGSKYNIMEELDEKEKLYVHFINIS